VLARKLRMLPLSVQDTLCHFHRTLRMRQVLCPPPALLHHVHEVLAPWWHITMMLLHVWRM